MKTLQIAVGGAREDEQKRDDGNHHHRNQRRVGAKQLVFKLKADNDASLVKSEPALGRAGSYMSVFQAVERGRDSAAAANKGFRRKVVHGHDRRAAQQAAEFH